MTQVHVTTGRKSPLPPPTYGPHRQAVSSPATVGP